jgi:hypothetical protein
LKELVLLLLNEFASEVVRREVKRIAFYFLLCEGDLCFDGALDRVQPITIVPDMEVLFIFEKESPSQFLFCCDYIFIIFK